MRIPARQDSPVLTSVLPVVEASNHVGTDEARLEDVAGWLAYEDLPMPQFLLPFQPTGDRGRVIDFVMVCASVDFAFTDRPTKTVNLALLLRQTPEAWLITHYQVSLLP